METDGDRTQQYATRYAAAIETAIRQGVEEEYFPTVVAPVIADLFKVSDWLAETRRKNPQLHQGMWAYARTTKDPEMTINTMYWEGVQKARCDPTSWNLTDLLFVSGLEDSRCGFA